MQLEPQAKLTIDDLEDFLDQKTKWKLSARSLAKVEKTAREVTRLSQSDRAIYGLNTGFGRLAQVRISRNELAELQLNIIRSHAAGVGDPIADRVVRRLLFLRTISLGKGVSGVSSALLKRHVDYINLNLTPEIPEQGSVGASGDLAPLAHLALTFIGEGYFLEKGLRKPATKVLKSKKLKTISLGPKEGLALVNGTQFSLALALEVRRGLYELLEWMVLAAALSVEGHRATRSVFDPDLHALKEHPHQREVAMTFWKLLANSPHMKGHLDCDIVQDSYSFRCIPQILGPCLALLDQADNFLEDELNSVSDNPLYIESKKSLISGGHFHAQAVSFASDLMAMAMATMGNLIERRVDQLVSPLTSRTSGFLAERPGVQSGLMIVHTAIAAITHENQTLAHPASASSIPTNGNQEDHVSMAPWAARKAGMMLKNLRRIVAGEVLCSVRACLLERERANLRFSSAVESFLSYLMSNQPSLFSTRDKVFSEDWKQLEKLISKSN